MTGAAPWEPTGCDPTHKHQSGQSRAWTPAPDAQPIAPPHRPGLDGRPGRTAADRGPGASLQGAALMPAPPCCVQEPGVTGSEIHGDMHGKQPQEAGGNPDLCPPSAIAIRGAVTPVGMRTQLGLQAQRHGDRLRLARLCHAAATGAGVQGWRPTGAKSYRRADSASARRRTGSSLVRGQPNPSGPTPPCAPGAQPVSGQSGAGRRICARRLTFGRRSAGCPPGGAYLANSNCPVAPPVE